MHCEFAYLFLNIYKKNVISKNLCNNNKKSKIISNIKLKQKT